MFPIRSEMETTTNDFKFQELCRVVDATTGTYNSSGLVTGHNCLNFIRAEFAKGLQNFVSPGLYAVIETQLQEAEGKANVREQVKKILTYPLQGYLPWKSYAAPVNLLQSIEKRCADIGFRLALVDGKVYACSDESIVDVVFTALKEYDPETFSKLRANAETSHITLVNSNVV